MGELLFGVDGDARARALRRQRRCQAQRARADHRDVAHPVGHRHRHGEFGRTPAQRPAAAAMAVIMDDALAPHLLDRDARAGRAERAQADRGAEDAIGAGADRLHPGEGIEGHGRSRRRRQRQRAAADPRAQKAPPVHVSSPCSLVRCNERRPRTRSPIARSASARRDIDPDCGQPAILNIERTSWPSCPLARS